VKNVTNPNKDNDFEISLEISPKNDNYKFSDTEENSSIDMNPPKQKADKIRRNDE